MTKSPAATSDSLFASAKRFPTLIALTVAAKPIDPVIALSTTSQVIEATRAAASCPSMTVTPGNASRMSSALWIMPTTPTLNFFACSIITAGLFPAEVMPTTRNFPGLAATISRAWTPIDPVEPRITRSLMWISSHGQSRLGK